MFALDVLPSSTLPQLLDLAERAARLAELNGTTRDMRDALGALQSRIADLLRGRSSLVSVTPGEDGGFVARGPNSAISQGTTLAEVCRNLAEAIEVSCAKCDVGPCAEHSGGS